MSNRKHRLQQRSSRQKRRFSEDAENNGQVLPQPTLVSTVNEQAENVVPSQTRFDPACDYPANPVAFARSRIHGQALPLSHAAQPPRGSRFGMVTSHYGYYTNKEGVKYWCIAMTAQNKNEQKPSDRFMFRQRYDARSGKARAFASEMNQETTKNENKSHAAFQKRLIFMYGQWTQFLSNEAIDNFVQEPGLESTTELVYRWPNDDITTVNHADKSARCFRLFDTYTAVACIFHILDIQWRLRPIATGTKPNDPDLRLWANVTTSYDSSGTLYFVKASHKTQEDVLGAFKWETGRWKPTGEDKDGLEKTQETNYKLYVRQLDTSDPEMFLCDTTSSLWYRIVTDVLDTPYSPNDFVGFEAHVRNVLGGSSGKWRLERTFDEGNAGTLGIISLWIQADAEDNILDRVVIKYVNTAHLEALIPKPRTNSIITHSLEAVYIHQLLTSKDTQNCIIPLRGWSLDHYSRPKMRQFIEFAPYGSLASVMEKHSVGRKYLPEVFIWLLFRNLVRACLLMEAENLCHIDLKCENVLIREYDPSSPYSGFPVPVVTDFDVTSHLDDMVADAGTLGFCTPEQVIAQSNEHGGPSTKLHVYATALVVWSTMRLRTEGLDRSPNSDEQYPFPDPQARRSVPGTLDPMSTPWYPDIGFKDEPYGLRDMVPNPKIYSTRLENLLRRCMQIERDQRPALQYVSVEIENALRDLEKRYPGLASATLDTLPEWMHVVDGPEGYQFHPPAKKHRWGSGT